MSSWHELCSPSCLCNPLITKHIHAAPAQVLGIQALTEADLLARYTLYSIHYTILDLACFVFSYTTLRKH